MTPELERIHRLLADLPEPLVAVVDRELKVLVIGGHASRGTRPGVGVEELLPAAGEHLRSACRQALATGRSLVELTGTGLIVEATRHPGRAADAPEVSLVVRDLARQREEQRSRERADGRYRDAFERAPVAMVHVDPEGRCVAVNEAMLTLIGAARHEVEGQELAGLCHPDDAPRVRRAVAAMSSGSLARYRSEDRYLPAGRPPVWASVTGAPMSGWAGEVSHLMFHLVDITDQRQIDDQLRAMVDEDPLTRVKNRRYFEAALSTQAGMVQRYGGGGALLMLDIDHFKQINDQHGHSAGDEVLVSVADVLRATLRTTDVVARIGGDEFAVILPQVTPEQAERTAGKVLDAVRSDAGVLVRGRRRQVTASIGVATLDRGVLSGADLLVRADLAMYDAKEAGRDRFALYPSAPGAPSPSASRLAWVEEVERALSEDGFAFHAQPIVDLRGGQVSHYELLLRMDGGDRGWVLPPMFLAAALRAGIADRIDRWTLAAAVDLLSDPGCPPDLAVSVNMSVASFTSRELAEWIEAASARLAALAGRLTVEIAEAAAVADLANATAMATRLGEVGCRIALDEFGAGFGSFSHLRQMPFDSVKIGGDYVRRCTDSPTDRLILAAMVDIAHGMGKAVVAEHVEDPTTLQLLRGEDVDLAQGYLLGHPVPVAELLSRG